LTFALDEYLHHAELTALPGFRALQEYCDNAGLRLECLEAFGDAGGIYLTETIILFDGFDLMPRRFYQLVIAIDETSQV